MNSHFSYFLGFLWQKEIGFLKTCAHGGLLLSLIFLNASCGKPVVESDLKHHQVIIGLSPFMDKDAKEAVYQRVVKLVLETMPVNGSVWIYDAYANQSIAKFEIPNRGAFRKTRTRINQFGQPLNELKSFLLNEAAQDDSGEEIQESFDIRYPQWIHFISKNIIDNEAQTSAVVLGSPFYRDARENGFSMKDGFFPSDAHLGVSEDVSIYGVSGHETDLQDVIMYWGFFKDEWISAVHEEKVTRFWSLFAQGQGGHLKVFCRDLPTVFDQLLTAKRKQHPPQDYAIDPNQSRVEMLRIKRDVGSSDWITSTLPDHLKVTPPSQLQGPMKIGIRWKGGMDLDLYARAHEGGQTLFFENAECPEGYYYKDHRNSPDREFEFIEYEKPVHLEKVRVWVNLFEGELSYSPVFEVRLEFDNQIYSTQMTIESMNGNRGRTGSDQNHCWVEIDIPVVMGIGK
ncbi:MAG: hypothetical protein HOH33_06530 [Verrucomicrobia bacterium]|jgi:hypothetical protein|nr:hypothetical protein [Verrucomicrobiota bacterium]